MQPTAQAVGSIELAGTSPEGAKEKLMDPNHNLRGSRRMQPTLDETAAPQERENAAHGASRG